MTELSNEEKARKSVKIGQVWREIGRAGLSDCKYLKVGKIEAVEKGRVVALQYDDVECTKFSGKQPAKVWVRLTSFVLRYELVGAVL